MYKWLQVGQNGWTAGWGDEVSRGQMIKDLHLLSYSLTHLIINTEHRICAKF